MPRGTFFPQVLQLKMFYIHQHILAVLNVEFLFQKSPGGNMRKLSVGGSG
jgi:hypothetical protein